MYRLFYIYMQNKSLNAKLQTEEIAKENKTERSEIEKLNSAEVFILS